MTVINISEFTKNQARNLTGHERGSLARVFYKLDDLDELHESVQVIVPDELDAITTSFFQGMFATSVKAFNTTDEFLAHYKFQAQPSIIMQIQRGIDRVKTRRGEAFS